MAKSVFSVSVSPDTYWCRSVRVPSLHLRSKPLAVGYILGRAFGGEAWGGVDGQSIVGRGMKVYVEEH